MRAAERFAVDSGLEKKTEVETVFLLSSECLLKH